MSSTVIDKTAEEILEYQGENDDLQLDYDDADAILDDDPEPSTVVSSKKTENQEETAPGNISMTNRQQSLVDEPEQLDYEEEIDMGKKETLPETVTSSIEDSSKKDGKRQRDRSRESRRESNEPSKKTGRKCFINPNFKGPLPSSLSTNLCRGPFSSNIGPNPSAQFVGQAPSANSVSNVMIRSLMRPMNPPLAQAMAVPPPNFAAPPPNLTAPLPTFPGMSVPMVPNLNVPPPMIPPNKMAADASWNFMVEAFVRKTHFDSSSDPQRSRRRSRSSSYSSQSRSYSSSSSASSRTRSRSRSPIRKPRGPRRISPRRDRYARDEYRRNDNNNRSNRDRDERMRRESPKIEAHTKECAEAIGLDADYLKKVEEQKRLREEIARRKSERRQQTYGKTEESQLANTSKRNEDRYRNRQETEGRPRGPRRLDRMDRERPGRSYERDGRDRQRETERDQFRRDLRQHEDQPKYTSNKIFLNDHKSFPTSATDSIEPASPDSGDTKKSKMKAYLAVVVSNVKELENVYKRTSLLASSIGPTKKVWQASENAVSIIFEKHEHAKQFMLQYHGKMLSGVRLDVTLEKVFLNLSAMP